MKVVLQKSFNDCGLACLSMVASHFKRKVELEIIASLLPIEEWQNGLSLKQLNELAVLLGFDARAVKCSIKKLGKMPLPGIAHCPANHYVVVEQVDDRYVRFLDPRHGRATLSLEEFEQMYSGIFLVFSNDDEKDESLHAARKLHRQLLSKNPWLHVSRQLFRRELGRLLLPAALYGCGLIASFSVCLGWFYSRVAVTPVILIVAIMFAIGLMLFRVTVLEDYLLKSYGSLTRRLGEECLLKSDNFYQDAQSYKLPDRYRWLVEFLYFQRHAIMSALQIFSSLIFAGIVTLLLGDWRASLVAMLFGLALALEIKGNLYAVDQNESRYFQKTLVRQILSAFENGHDETWTEPHAPFNNGVVSFRSRRWWLPALTSYIPAVILLATLLWTLRGSPSDLSLARLVLLVSLFICHATWQFVKGQVSGFLAISIGLQQLNFMSFMRQLNDSHALRRQAGKN